METGDKGQVFRMNLAAGLKTLDPAFAGDKRAVWMTAQLYNGLVELDGDLHVQPAIAKRWEISEDGKTYRFILKDSVLYHSDKVFEDLAVGSSRQNKFSTRKVVASDFVYSFTRVCNPATASSGAWIFSGKIKGLESFKIGDNPQISGFQAPNDTTFEVHLTAPFPPFLGLLAMPYCYVVPKEAVEFYGDRFRANPVGTGPFRLFRWEEGHHLILHKHPFYFEKENGAQLPYLDALSVRFMPSKLSAFVEFLQGKLDFINGIDDSYKDEILNLDGSIKDSYASRFQFELAPQLNIEYLGMLVDSSLEAAKGHPLSDLRVRQALNYAIDRQKMVRYLLNGMGYPAESGFVPNGMPGFDATAVPGYTYDLNKAHALLKEAGYPNGEGLPQLTLNSTAQYAHISEYVQKSFEQIGVSLDVQNMQGGTLREASKGGRINLWRGSWIADYPEGENYLALFYTPNQAPNGPNTTRFSHPNFDELYRNSQGITDDSLRQSYYQEMDRLMLAHAPIIPLYYDRSLRILQKGITGLVGNPMNHLQLKRVKKGEESKNN